MPAMMLKPDLAGHPVRWVSLRQGALLYCRNQVAWTAGRDAVRLFGGTNRRGDRFCLEVDTIVAVRSVHPHAPAGLVPKLTNRGLFRRDGCTCLYCGERQAA